MNYRINSEYPAPFRIFPSVIEVSNYKLEFDLRIKASYPKEIGATYVHVKIPLPKDNSKIHYELPKVRNVDKSSFFVLIFMVQNAERTSNISHTMTIYFKLPRMLLIKLLITKKKKIWLNGE